jgi:hypothetical protein
METEQQPQAQRLRTIFKNSFLFILKCAKIRPGMDEPGA